MQTYGTDDALAEIDDRFVTGYFTARYVAYVVFAVLFLVVMYVEGLAGLTIDWFQLSLTIAGTVWATRRILAGIDHDTPLWAVLVGFWHEISAPRHDGRVISSHADQSRVRRL